MRKPRLSHLDGRGRTSQQRRTKKAPNPWSTGTLLRFEPLESRRLLHGGDGEPPADALDDHIHYAMTILIDGESMPLPANIGVSNTALISPIHTHDVDGRIHDEPINGVIPTEFHTVGDFFAAWRTLGGLAGNNPDANFSETQLLSSTVDATHEVRMYVNGERNFQFDAYIPHDEDDIVLTRTKKSAAASVVLTRFETTQGTLDVELLRDAAPESVENFLNYVNDGDYVNSILHRSLPGFITQFGGFNVDFAGGYDRVSANPAVINEPNISNTERTIAYAKLGNLPDSATNQWFVNLGNNASNLDNQNGGFTVFGRLINNTYEAAVAQSLIPTFNATSVDDVAPFVSGAFTNLPIVDFPGGPINGSDDVDQNDLVVVTSATVVPTAMIVGIKYNDLNANGVREAGEPGLAGWTIYLDDNGNGVLNAGERSTVTEEDGHYRFTELLPGNYEVREVLQNGFSQSAPGSGFHLVSLDHGDAAVDVDFGNFSNNPPASIDLLPASDSGGSSADNLTNLTELTFRVSGVTDGATVLLYMDGEIVGFDAGPASGGSVEIVTIDEGGETRLTDGPHAFHATQVLDSGESGPSQSLVVTIDTAVAPFNSLALSNAIVGESYFYGASNAGENTTLSYALIDSPAGMTINASLGQIFWTPSENQIGPQTFEILATDRAGNTLNQISNVTVAGNLPVLADHYDVNEDNTLQVDATSGVLDNDGDQASGTLTATLLSGPDHGTLSLNSDGSFSYVPNANFFGTDSFTYEAADDVRTSPAATATILVAAVDDPSVAVPDSYSIDEDTPRTVDAAGGVLANDQDVDGDTLSVELVDSTSNGQLTLAADGSFTYTPNANYHGPDSFTYRINDGQGLSNTATVDFVVRSINDTPVADNDNYNVDEDDVLVVPAGEGVLVGDADADDDSLSALLVDLPEHGSVQLAADGSFTYTPDENFHGQDRFTYRADDGQDQSNLAEVTIDVASVNDPTVAHDDLFTLNEDETLNRDAVDGVLANDFEVDGDPLEVILVDGPTHGQLTLRSDGSLTYVPEANFHGDDSFTYKVDDGTADSNTATVVLRVTSVNDPPVADGESYATDEDTTLVVGASEGVLVGDTDVEGSDLTATLVDPPEHGNVQLAADGSFTYTPNDNFHGQDGFTYRADDGQDESNLAEVTIDVAPVDDPTVAADDLFTLNEDQTLDRDAVDGVLANDFEVDGDPLEVILVDGPTHGQLTLNSDGSFSYVPETNFHGDDSFTYKVNDGVSDSNLATAELRVTSVNDPPVADDESYTVDEDTTLNVDASEGVLVGDTDVEGSDLTATLVDPPQNGSVQLAADGSFTYMPHDNFAGSDHFTYRAHDGQDASNLAQVTIAVNPIDDPPVAVTDLFTVNEDEVLNPAAVDGVLANDIEVDGDPLTATLVEGPTSGQVTFNSDGSFVYVPNENFNGGDQFSYRISDGITDSNVVQALIIVEPVNDAPVATPDEYSVDEDTSLIVDAADGLLANDSDIDSGSLGATLVDGPAHGQVEVGNDGSFRYVPDADFNGTDTFTYRADDAIDASATVEVTMTVNPVDDPPRIDPVADQTTFTGSEFNLNITASDPDNSGAGIEFSLADDAPSDATIDPISGLLAWTPAEEDAGEVTFSIRATNTQTGLSSSITVNVQVFSSSALQALEEANARRRASRRSIPSERRALRSRAVLRRISRGPASLLSLGSVGRPSGIATGQIGVNTGVANITTSSDAEQMEDDAKKDAEKKDDSKRERKRRRPEDNSETNEQSSDAQRRAHDEAVNQLRIDKSSIPADSLQDLASNKIEERLRDWSEAGALQPAPIDVAADVVTSNLARGVTPPRAMPAVTPLPRELVVVMANDDAPTQAEEITETSDDLPVETVVAVAAAGTLALPLLVTGLKRYTRSPTQRALSALVHRLRD